MMVIEREKRKQIRRLICCCRAEVVTSKLLG